MASFKSKHQSHYQWSEVQELVRNFAEQLRQGQDLDKRTEDAPQVLPQNYSKSQDSSTTHEVLQSNQQHKIDLNAFRKAWQRKQDRADQPQSSPAIETIDQPKQVIAETSRESASKQQWDFEQGCWLSAPPLSQRPSKESTSTSQHLTPSLDRNPKDLSKKNLLPQPVNPWEMLRDHFIALRERRIALEKSADRKEHS